jgi:hypothetical protein
LRFNAFHPRVPNPRPRIPVSPYPSNKTQDEDARSRGTGFIRTRKSPFTLSHPTSPYLTDNPTDQNGLDTTCPQHGCALEQTRNQLSLPHTTKRNYNPKRDCLWVRTNSFQLGDKHLKVGLAFICLQPRCIISGIVLWLKGRSEDDACGNHFFCTLLLLPRSGWQS